MVEEKVVYQHMSMSDTIMALIVHERYMYMYQYVLSACRVTPITQRHPTHAIKSMATG